MLFIHKEKYFVTVNRIQWQGNGEFMLKDYLISKRKISRGLLYVFGRKEIRRRIPDSLYLRIRYYFQTGHMLHLNHPKTFNEKLQWLKIYNRDPEYVKMVDKYAVKDYVSKKIGEEYVVRCYGVWESAESINFGLLPDKFVLKSTHDSGSVFICTDKGKLNIDELRSEISRWQKRDVYHWAVEWPYKGVTPRIIAEEYLADNLKDYKFFCFNGRVKCFKVDFNRFSRHQANYYDRNLHILPFGESLYPPDYEKNIEFPGNVERMIDLAEQLASGIPFVRIDFYNINGKIYFGEITFFPASGFGEFTDESWNLKLGEWLKLPYQIREDG